MVILRRPIPLIEEILGKIKVNDEVAYWMRGRNFVRSAMLMQQSGCNSSDIEFVKELALKQFLAHRNYPGLFMLMAEWQTSNDKIKELSQSQIDRSLTFLDYAISYEPWSFIEDNLRNGGRSAVNHMSEDVAKADSSAARLKAELEDVKREFAELKAAELRLELKPAEEDKKEEVTKEAQLMLESSQPKEDKKEEVSKEIEPIKLGPYAKTEEVDIESLKIRAKREAAELKISQLEVALKKAELKVTELKIALNNAKRKVKELG